MNQKGGEEATEIGRGFLLKRYLGARVTFDRVVLTGKETSDLYHLEGKIIMPSRGLISRLISTPEQYTFMMEVDASRGKILSWELK